MQDTNVGIMKAARTNGSRLRLLLEATNIANTDTVGSDFRTLSRRQFRAKRLERDPEERKKEDIIEVWSRVYTSRIQQVEDVKKVSTKQ